MSAEHADLYAVFGNPIAHSKSPQIHAMFAKQTGQCMQYEKRLAPLDGFSTSIADFIAQGGRGANITVPFKLQAHALASQLSARALAAGAVNTLSFIDGQIHADNTDGLGLVRDIVHNAGQTIAGQRVLILGAGGATRGTLLPLLQEAPHSLTVANRTASNAAALAQAFANQAGDCQLHACGLAEIHGQFDLIINATSASLNAEMPTLPEGIFAPEALAYDMVYGNTPFLAYAQERGARCRDGLGMLIEQAAEAFFIWRKVRPETAAVFATLLSEK